MVYFIRYIIPIIQFGIRYIMPGPRWYILLGILYLLSNWQKCLISKGISGATVLYGDVTNKESIQVIRLAAS